MMAKRLKRRPRNQYKVHRGNRRRGVLLLIVLSLLVLFMLVGLSFIVSAGQFKSMAKASARTGLTGTEGSKLANNAMYQLVRGTHNPTSPIRGHSLLEDLYGRDYFVGRVTNPKFGSPSIADATNNQFHEVQFDFVAGRHGDLPADQLRDDYYGGCVLTFISGTASGKSVRITKYRNTGGLKTVRFEGILTAAANGNVLPAVKANDLFVVNGRPLNGTGAGFTTDDVSTFTPVDNNPWKLNNGVALGPHKVPVAFMPNYTAYREMKSLEEISFGGLDESWDAVDYQNVFLAKVPSRTEFNLQQGQAAEQTTGFPNFYSNTGGIIPSFHRPYLLAYLQKHYPGLLENATLRRNFVFRPDRADHPGFTGSNPSYDPLIGPYDVDNDGDGIPDSIWIDLGLDAVTGADGRLYKPLVAPLILDMDGKVNLNTAGSLWQMEAMKRGGQSVKVSHQAAGPILQEFQNNWLTGGGWGPADVNLMLLAGNASIYEQILRRRYAGFGEDIAVAVPGSPTNTSEMVDEDTAVNAAYRITGNSGVPDNYFLPDQSLINGFQTSLVTGYGAPVDLSGRGTPFLSPTGNIMWGGLSIGALESIDDPYEFDPLNPSSRDTPYTLADLDYLLRFEDSRSQSRLRDINDTAASDSPFEVYQVAGADGRRRLFTTHSVHIPALPSINSGKWRHNYPLPDGLGEGLQRSVREMFAAKIRRILLKETPNTNPVQLDQSAFALAGELLPPEIARGEKLDINQALQGTPVQKRRFATQLFHMMMLLVDEDLDIPTVDTGLTQEQRHELHVRRIAQWAINVVDFGDADSTMTFFEYDVNPFNAKRVNGNPLLNTNDSEDARRIWGCEHPELLLSETLAIHDRRVKDLNVGEGKRKENGEVKDPDLDQEVPPEGSLFIELLCVRGTSPANGEASRSPRLVSERGPEDLYNTHAPNTDRRAQIYMPTLNLAQVDVNGNPVWRIGISERQTESAVESPTELSEARPEVTSFEPSDFNLLPTNNPRVNLTRFIWFTMPNNVPATNVFFTQEFYHRGSTNRITRMQQFDLPVVEPGGYVVIGPDRQTTVGLTKTGEASQQRIGIDQLNHQNVDAFQLRSSLPSRALTIVAKSNSGNGVNISEPINGYPELTSARDRPLDSPESPVNAEAAPLWYSDENVDDADNMQLVTGTRRGFRTVYLQRLANPALPWNPMPGQPGHNAGMPSPNPYITIDWMPVDLTVFNSADEAPLEPEEPADEPFDPQDPAMIADGLVPQNLLPGVDQDGYLASREKAGLELNDYNIFSSRTAAGRSTVPQTLEGLTQSTRNVTHTLGWLNRTFDYDGTADAEGHFIPPGNPYSEAPNSRITGRTFPNLVWNNRPYTSEYELMLVPACSQARLSQEFTTSRDAPATIPLVKGSGKKQVLDTYIGHFGHLLNFFNSTSSTPQESQPATLGHAGNYYRIFDFVGVPSRFRDTQKWYRDPIDPSSPDRNLSKFREPGRINLNTAGDRRIWRDALGIGGFHDSAWQEFEWHMRGLSSAGAALGSDDDDDNDSIFGEDGEALVGSPLPNGDFPAEYPYPFRASVSADLLPPFLTNNGRARPPLPAIDATLLRTSALAGGADGLTPLGQSALAKYRDPKFGFDGFGPAAQNRKTSAFFRYRDIQKIANSVTSQSNVYAIWLTIGFFEIEPNFPVTGQNGDGSLEYDLNQPYHVDAAHPDGYRYGIEMGSDMGNVTRHRSFYIIDRSIPVAFEPGVNHNVDDAILLRRNLE